MTHGTLEGYIAHCRASEHPCDACADAVGAKRRGREDGAKERKRQLDLARQRALQDLAEMHPGDYRRALVKHKKEITDEA